jgi:hypothetical protein
MPAYDASWQHTLPFSTMPAYAASSTHEPVYTAGLVSATTCITCAQQLVLRHALLVLRHALLS